MATLVFRNSLFHLIKALKYADTRSFLCLLLNNIVSGASSRSLPRAVRLSARQVASREGEAWNERCKGRNRIQEFLGETQPARTPHIAIVWLAARLPPEAPSPSRMIGALGLRPSPPPAYPMTLHKSAPWSPCFFTYKACVVNRLLKTDFGEGQTSPVSRSWHRSRDKGKSSRHSRKGSCSDLRGLKNARRKLCPRQSFFCIILLWAPGARGSPTGSSGGLWRKDKGEESKLNLNSHTAPVGSLVVWPRDQSQSTSGSGGSYSELQVKVLGLCWACSPREPGAESQGTLLWLNEQHLGTMSLRMRIGRKRSESHGLKIPDGRAAQEANSYLAGEGLSRMWKPPGPTEKPQA